MAHIYYRSYRGVDNCNRHWHFLPPAWYAKFLNRSFMYVLITELTIYLDKTKLFFKIRYWLLFLFSGEALRPDARWVWDGSNGSKLRPQWDAVQRPTSFPPHEQTGPFQDHPTYSQRENSMKKLAVLMLSLLTKIHRLIMPCISSSIGLNIWLTPLVKNNFNI